MYKLLSFLYRYRACLTFLFLSLTSTLLIARQPNYAQLPYLATVHDAAGYFHQLLQEAQGYLHLKQAYTALLDEKAAVYTAAIQRGLAASEALPGDTERYTCIPARVVNNAIMGTRNHLTIDKGAQHGIVAGMGVIGARGIVGKVKAVSQHFATITSLLHTDMWVSAQVIRTGVMGTVRWLGQEATQAQLLYVPRHVSVAVGDQVVTSGYNTVFPASVCIGYVQQTHLSDGAAFHDIVLEISTDFSTLQHVYVVQDRLQQEKEAVEKGT